MPVFNNERTVGKAIKSIQEQSFIDFELIISDNNSTDLTANICKKFAKKDPRIIFKKQLFNIGAAKNFRFVFDCAKGKYFCWAAGDDFRSNDFLEENVKFLEANKNYIASTSPNIFEKSDPGRAFTFEIVGSKEDRFKKFFKYCWNSHAIYYSLFRRKPLNKSKIIGKSFIAADWAFNLDLLKLGHIHRTSKGLITFGVKGVSLSKDPWSPFRRNYLEWFFPFLEFTKFALKETIAFSFKNKFLIYSYLIKLNLVFSYRPIRDFVLLKFSNLLAQTKLNKL